MASDLSDPLAQALADEDAARGVDQNNTSGAAGGGSGQGQPEDSGSPVMRWWRLAREDAKRNPRKTPWDVLMAIMDIESGGQPDAESKMNFDQNKQPIGQAQGLMQIMPFHFGFQLGDDGKLSAAQKAIAQDPETNMSKADDILFDLHDKYKNWEDAVRHYFGIGEDAYHMSDEGYWKKFQDAWAKYLPTPDMP